MSDNGYSRQLVSLLAGRWQIPVALAAAVTAGVTLYRLIPPHTEVDIATALAEVAALEQASDPTDAAEVLDRLLRMEPPLPAERRAELHDRLSEVVYQQELTRDKPDLERVRQVLEHHDTAIRLGYPQNASRTLRAARAAEWLSNAARAISLNRAVLEQGPVPEQRRQALQGLVQQLDQRSGAGRERQQRLEELLADDGVSVSYLCWGLQEALQDALDENDTARARRLLEQYGGRLKSSDLRGYWEYLGAWITVCEGRPEEAAPLVRWIDDWLGTRPLAERESAGVGDLPAMNRWLMAQIHLAERHPEAALKSYEEAVGLQPFGPLCVAAEAGRARALAQLGQFGVAQQALHDAVARLAGLPGGSQLRGERLRRRLFEVFDELVQRHAYSSPVEYVLASPDELTMERLRLLAELERDYQRAADEGVDEAARREARGEAGRCLEQVSELTRPEDPRAASLLWLAGQEYEQAWRPADTQRVLRRFVKGRALDPRVPPALLQLGQACELSGDPDEALRWYGRLITDYPKLGETHRAVLCSAGCLRTLGRKAEAEAGLRALLADDDLAPQATVFRDGLWELCELLGEQSRYGETIARREEFATLYPEDAERYSNEFLLADAYRHSAEALRALNNADADPAQAVATGRERFRRAAELYDGLLQDLAGAGPDEALALYERLALFYRADCLFALNDAESLQAALEAYRRAAARYQAEPEGLTAEVQTASTCLRLGLLEDAARAVDRARRVLSNIPDSALAADPGGADRAHWDRYLSAILSSPSFRNAFTGRP